MTQKITRILSLSISVLLLASLFFWTTPVSAGVSEWSAETILSNMLGPGVDIRDMVVANDAITVYAVPASHVVYKSTNGGVSWTALTVSIRADLVAIAPDDKNIVAVSNTTAVCLSVDGGAAWQTLGTIQDTAVGAAAAAAIYDIAISPDKDGIHYIAAAGKDKTNAANLWYFDYGATSQTWQETKTFTGFDAASEAAALAFSPDFSSDGTLAVITDNVSVGVKLQLLKIDTEMWNTDASYTDFPCTVISATGTSLTSASLALAPTYTGDDAGSRKVFIGLTVDGAPDTSGIYRFVDTVETNILTNTKIHSIAYNGSYLIAGSYDTNTVYRSTNPLSSSPTVSTSYATKCPGGENKVVVAWLGSSVVAGTSGNESAFARSTDTGTTFNDISLIDTAITNARDVAVSSDGSKVYFITDDGADLSVWRRASAWQRVFSLKGATNFFVRIEPSSADVIYLVKKGTTTIYYNNAGGLAEWLTRTCRINVQDMAVESTAVAYALDATGRVSKTSNGGARWSTPTLTNLSSGATIVSVSTGTLLAGSQNGFVAYSTNGSATWTKISQQVESGAGKVQVIADDNFTANNIIYAASDTPGNNIMEWTIGTSTVWTDIFNLNIPGGIYGLAIDSNTLYALEFNAGTSTLWRLLAPADAPAASTEWTSSTTTTTTVWLNATPQALKASTGKLWAVNTNAGNKLYSYSDAMANVIVRLLQPANGYRVHVNSLNGIAYDIPFTWQRPTVATEYELIYELIIAQDKDFNILVTPNPIIVNMLNATAFVLVGPQQVGFTNFDFMPGVMYYWKVRTKAPGYSQYSETRYFTIESLPNEPAAIIVSGENGMITGTQPAFSWLPLQGATEYQFMLSDNPDMTSPILDTKLDTTSIKIQEALEYGKTYFWQVRATTPIASSWSALVTFTVAEKPTEAVPPVIFSEVPPTTITISASAPQETVLKYVSLPSKVIPDYVWGIIAVMSILLCAVVILIYMRIPPRLVPASPPHERAPGPYRKTTIPGTKPAEPQVKTETRPEGIKPPEPAEKTTARPVTMKKSKESEAVIFAAKSFMWMTTAEKETGEGHPAVSAKEQESLGRKLSSKIQGLAKKENLYIAYPEDAAMLLSIWARYGSRDAASNYLAKSFKSRPENAIKLLKCYLPSAAQAGKGRAAAELTRDNYDSISKVIDPDKIYAALTGVFKFKADTIEGKSGVKPADRNLAFIFLRLHHQAKNGK